MRLDKIVKFWCAPRLGSPGDNKIDLGQKEFFYN